MRSASLLKFQLDTIPISKGGYNPKYLSDESGLGQANRKRYWHGKFTWFGKTFPSRSKNKISLLSTLDEFIRVLSDYAPNYLT